MNFGPPSAKMGLSYVPTPFKALYSASCQPSLTEVSERETTKLCHGLIELRKRCIDFGVVSQKLGPKCRIFDSLAQFDSKERILPLGPTVIGVMRPKMNFQLAMARRPAALLLPPFLVFLFFSCSTFMPKFVLNFPPWKHV